MPYFSSRSRLYSMIGLPPTGNNGFGVSRVNGNNLLPSPPAIITARPMEAPIVRRSDPNANQPVSVIQHGTSVISLFPIHQFHPVWIFVFAKNANFFASLLLPRFVMVLLASMPFWYLHHWDYQSPVRLGWLSNSVALSLPDNASFDGFLISVDWCMF